MDIEGAEFDIIPCLANSPQAHLVDKLFMEVHNPSWGLVGTSEQDFQQAQAVLRRQGVAIPAYNSPTLVQTFSHTGTAPVARIDQIMVLTYAERTRAYKYEQVFPGIRVTWMVGVTATDFASEEDMMNREELVPMSEQMKAQWRSNPSRHQNRIDGRPLGTLACALGHYKAWQTAVASLSGREWMIILEDLYNP